MYCRECFDLHRQEGEGNREPCHQEGRRQGGQAAEQTPAEEEARGGDHDLAVMGEYSSRGQAQAAIIMGCFNCISQVIFTKVSSDEIIDYL